MREMEDSPLVTEHIESGIAHRRNGELCVMGKFHRHVRDIEILSYRVQSEYTPFSTCAYVRQGEIRIKNH